MPEKLLTLERWAEAVYGESAPSLATLRRWARECRIYPPAEKHGRTYFVSESARYLDPSKPLPASLRPEKARPLSLVERIRQEEAGRKRR
ncbi:excisionase [Azospirillum doebereinerae]|uniref:excisionase n=1 Tax=Azospirillum doebereinerae TaxID=92933 RepID=UPI001EE57A9F|nr:excisionase [Azospirillum doebereinerae]MCG5240859.1 hypothetical protein [Azospirillum doebereinerae]